MKTKITTTFLLLLITSISFAQIVTIPDANFKLYLVTYSGADTNSDGEIQVSEAAAFTGDISPDGFDIYNLTGIEAFINITHLDVSFNYLTSVDLSLNTLLTYLDLDHNNFAVIDVSHNSALTSLDCSDNNLSTLNISTNPSLISLKCYNNNLTAINQNAPDIGVNLNYNPVLEFFGCSNNNFVDIAIFNHSSLIEILCNDISSLNNLNLSTLSALENLECNDGGLNNLILTNLSALTTLYCFNTDIASIPTSQLPVLEILRCYDNPNLISLDCSTNNSLTTIDTNNSAINIITLPSSVVSVDCSSNNLFSINLNGAPNLTFLDCSYNGLNSISTNYSPSIETLYCNNNNITSLNLHPSSNSLTTLRCNNNQLATLDVTKQLNLTELKCNTNLITSLSLQFNDLLVSLECNINQLEYLNLTGSSRSNLTTMNTTNNASLTCIMVDDAPAIGVIATNNSWSKDASAFYGEDCYVYIPDPNFEQALIDVSVDAGIINKYVDIGNVNALINLNVDSSSIYDLTGLEKFAVLETLSCQSNVLASVDLSNNTSLTGLAIGGNLLTNLDLSANTNLDILYCHFNQLTSLDLSTNTLLTSLVCNDNLLNSLSIYNSPLLSVIACSNNQLASLNLSSNTALIGLNCSNNLLSSLNISSNTAMTTLYASDNQISSINLFSNTALSDLRLTNNSLTALNVSLNTSLTKLFCNENQITDLDIGTNSSIIWLVSNDNNLTGLNIANGNNANMSYMYTYNNPLLTCIQVDDENNSPPAAHDWQKDAAASYNDDCSVPLVTLLIEPRVYLQGPMQNPANSELMNDDLRAASLLPTTSPYADAATVSSVLFDLSGSTAIVDWVWVELRDPNNSATVIAAKSALVNRKGYVLKDNSLAVEFENLPEGNYYIAINHRNHLGILSANTVALSDSSTSIDLAGNISSVNGGTNAVIALGNGKFAMYSGDYDNNSQIQNTDLTSITPLIGQPSAYDDADLDMNTQVQNTDINNLLNPNLGKGQQYSRIQPIKKENVINKRKVKVFDNSDFQHLLKRIEQLQKN